MSTSNPVRFSAAPLERVGLTSAAHRQRQPSASNTTHARVGCTLQAMAEDVDVHVQLSAEQVEALRRELTSALDQLDALDHLCSVRAIADRLEEAICAALYIVDRADARPPKPSA
jgi:hypothetical protein